MTLHLSKNSIFTALFSLLLFATACKKDGFNPDKPKNGQEVELYVGHYQSTDNPMVFLLPENEPSPLGLEDFSERELGYTYKIKAKVIVPKEPMQDGPSYWFEFVKVLSKEKYTSNEPFEISLLYHSLFGSGLAFGKINSTDGYEYIGYSLKPANQEIETQLDNIYLQREKFWKDQEYVRGVTLRATVVHDPENPGKGYVVRHVDFKE